MRTRATQVIISMRPAGWVCSIIHLLLVCFAVLMLSCAGPPRPTGTIQDAVKAGDVEQVRLHLKWMEPQDRGGDGWRALQLAASRGNLELVELMIDRGIPLDKTSRRVSQPLHYAACKGHTEVMALLISRGARVDARDGYDKTPLHWAAECGQPEAAKLLLEHGAEVNADSKFGTPAHAAAANRHLDVYDLLLLHGGRE